MSERKNIKEQSAIDSCILIIILYFIQALFFSNVKAQNKSTYCFVINQLDSAYSSTHYTLSTDEFYKVSQKIELYNIMPDTTMLILISVLPSFDGNGNWKEVSHEQVNSKIRSPQDLLTMARDKLILQPGQAKKYFISNGVIKKVGNRYYAAKKTLIEFFSIRDISPIFNAPYGTLNIRQKKLSILAMEQVYKSSFPKQSFPLDPHNKVIMPDFLTLRREYLSKELTILGQKAYFFWTFADWHVDDDYNTDRGIDRFIYVPGKGIIGGSYDFYFMGGLTANGIKHNNITMDQWKDQIMNEKVMTADELK